MKFLQACLPILVFPFLLSAADIYVSENGSNANDGSMGNPYANISHAIQQSGSGDTIYIERGSVFRESDLQIASGRILEAYGDAEVEQPVICGSVVVSDWTTSLDHAGAWEADLSESVNDGEPSLFVNGIRMTLARFPNSGWLRVDNGTSANQIIDSALSAGDPGQWTGAQVRWRKWSWWYETRPITGDNGNGTLNLGGSSSIANLTGIDSGYFIDNHPVALDAPGEWYWDRSANKLIVYPPAGTDLNDSVVEMAVRSNGVRVSSSTLRNVIVRHYTSYGVSISGASTVEDCIVEHIWDKGISGSWGAAGAVVRNNIVQDILNVGINWNENPGGAGGSIIERNQILRCGVVPGMGGNGPWHAAGVIISNAPFGNKGVQFRLNRVEDTGYAGIILGRDGQTVERNVFRRTMSTLNDGAAIYTNCSYSFIRENIILDVEGDLESSHPWTPLGAGIWLEFLNNFHDSEVEYNTVYGSGGDGLFLPNNFNCTVRGNIFLSNLRGGMTVGGHENGRSDGQTNQNHLFENNLFGIGAVPWSPTGYRNLATWGDRNDVCLVYKVYDDRDLDFGSMTGTQFLTQDGQDLVETTSGTSYSILSWQQNESVWADADPESVTGAGYLFINDTEDSVDFPLPADVTWQTLSGAAVGESVSIAPFRSIVLLSGEGVIEGMPGYSLYSELPVGVDWAAWLLAYELTGADALPDADPDMDGVANILEYLSVTSPVDGAEGPDWDLVREGSTVFLEFTLRDQHPSWTVSGEGSADLNTWETVPMESQGTGVKPGTTVYRMAIDTDSLPFVRTTAASAGTL